MALSVTNHFDATSVSRLRREVCRPVSPSVYGLDSDNRLDLLIFERYLISKNLLLFSVGVIILRNEGEVPREGGLQSLLFIHFSLFTFGDHRRICFCPFTFFLVLDLGLHTECKAMEVTGREKDEPEYKEMWLEVLLRC